MSFKPVHVIVVSLTHNFLVCLLSFFLLRFLLERWWHVYPLTLLSFFSSLAFPDAYRDNSLSEHPACTFRLRIHCFLAHSKDRGRHQARECEDEKITQIQALSHDWRFHYAPGSLQHKVINIPPTWPQPTGFPPRPSPRISHNVCVFWLRTLEIHQLPHPSCNIHSPGVHE